MQGILTSLLKFVLDNARTLLEFLGIFMLGIVWVVLFAFPLSWLLWKARKLVFPGAIQVSRRGRQRLPRRSEALSLALGALGTVNRHAGVMTLNIKSNGRRVALVLIEDAEFGQDSQGNTTLDEINDES